MPNFNRVLAGLLIAVGVIVVIAGLSSGLLLGFAGQSAASALLVPLVCIGIGGAAIYGASRIVKERVGSPTSGTWRTAPLIWTCGAIVFAAFGYNGIKRLASSVSWRDPEAWCLGLFGLAAFVMIGYGVRTQHRFRRAGEAVESTATPVIIAFDRPASLLFALGLLLLEPELLLSAYVENDRPILLSVIAVAAWIIAVLRKLNPSPAPTVIDEAGIESPDQWQGRIRWQDLDDIRVERAVAPGRYRMSVQCLAFIFRDGAPVPRRSRPQTHLDAKLALGCFMIMPVSLGLPLAQAVNGLKMRLERYRDAQPSSNN